MNAAIWGKARRVIPRITQEDGDHLDISARWLNSTRAAVVLKV